MKGLAQRVCRYFLDFLETDFKRQQAPRRRILGRTDSGQPTGINLRKYRKLYEEIWKAAGKPLQQGSRFVVTRKGYTAQLSPILQDLIGKHVAAIEDRLFDEAWAAGLEFARRNRLQAAKDIEKYVEDVLGTVGSALDKKVVAPLLALLDEPVKKQAYSPVDSIYEIEAADLLESLLRRLEEQLPSALTSFAIER